MRRRRLDQHGFERVLAWGHPDGLAMGLDPGAFADALAQSVYGLTEFATERYSCPE